MSNLPESRLALPNEVAEYFNTTIGALHVQRHRGQPPGSLAIKVGRRLMYDPAAIRSWVKGQTKARV